MAGTHVITASVTDSGGLSGAATVTLVVEPPVNTAPLVGISQPASGTTVLVGASIAFTGTATDAQDGNMSANLVWTSNTQGQIGTGASFSFSGLTVGSHTITAAVTDSGGLPGSAAVIVIVQPPPNTAPTVTITAPPNGTTVNQGASLTFTATATDTQDGNLGASLVWFSNLQGPDWHWRVLLDHEPDCRSARDYGEGHRQRRTARIGCSRGDGADALHAVGRHEKGQRQEVCRPDVERSVGGLGGRVSQQRQGDDDAQRRAAHRPRCRTRARRSSIACAMSARSVCSNNATVTF